VYSSDVSLSFHSEEMLASHGPAVQAAASQQEVTSKEPVSALNLENLSTENARLARENAILRQKCLEVAQAASQAAAASANAPATHRVEPDQFADTRACGTRPSAMPAAAGPLNHQSSPTAQTGPAMMPGVAQQQFAWFCQLPGFGGPVLAIPAGAMPMMTAPGASVQAMAEQHTTPQPPPQVQFAESQLSKAVRKQIMRQQNMRPQNMHPQNMHLKGAGHAGAQELGGVFDSVEIPQATDSEVERTTVMLRNIPNNYNRSMLLKLMDSEGFAGRYDFVYLPVDFKSRATLGYAFVNLTSHEAAASFMTVFRGYSNWVLPSRKVCSVDWSGPHQGLEAHVERYRNSPVMHEVVPDMYKPILFKDGVKVPFPPPTKKLREPRIRNY